MVQNRQARLETSGGWSTGISNERAELGYPTRYRSDAEKRGGGWQVVAFAVE